MELLRGNLGWWNIMIWPEKWLKAEEFWLQGFETIMVVICSQFFFSKILRPPKGSFLERTWEGHLGWWNIIWPEKCLNHWRGFWLDLVLNLVGKVEVFFLGGGLSSTSFQLYISVEGLQEKPLDTISVYCRGPLTGKPFWSYFSHESGGSKKNRYTRWKLAWHGKINHDHEWRCIKIKSGDV